MPWLRSLFIVSIALAYANVVLVSASPALKSTSDHSLNLRLEDGLSQSSKQIIDTRATIPTNALSLHSLTTDTLPNPNAIRSLTLSPRASSDSEKPLYYKICRREDNVGCVGDVACLVIANILVPMLLILFGNQQITRGFHIRPAHTIPPIALLLCNKLQKAVDDIHVDPTISDSQEAINRLKKPRIRIRTAHTIARNTENSQNARALTIVSLQTIKDSVPPEIAARTIDNVGKGDGGKFTRHINAMFQWVTMEQERADAAEARERVLQQQLSDLMVFAGLKLGDERQIDEDDDMGPINQQFCPQHNDNISGKETEKGRQVVVSDAQFMVTIDFSVACNFTKGELAAR
ncbi:MAG: hypothetical protein M1836_007100 [Candelina mexicana]|nr:MAG: hypothetical protein M1836_007100 [Candelina mexicana]